MLDTVDLNHSRISVSTLVNLLHVLKPHIPERDWTAYDLGREALKMELRLLLSKDLGEDITKSGVDTIRERLRAK